jgi:hypothetical protein
LLLLLSRIDGDAPRALEKMAAAFWMVREQADLNLQKPLF